MKVNKILVADRGLNVRAAPNLKALIIRTIPKNAIFHAVDISKFGEDTWAENAEDEFLQIAHGHNYYVHTAADVAPPRPPSLDWVIEIDLWAREHGYTGPRP